MAQSFQDCHILLLCYLSVQCKQELPFLSQTLAYHFLDSVS